MRRRCELGPVVDRRRHLTQGRRLGQYTPAAVHGRPAPQPADDSPHRHHQLHRHRRAGAVPTEQARAVRQQAGRSNGRRSEFSFSVLEVDHIIPRGGGGQDNIENLQLLYAHCNRVKGDRPQEYLVATLRKLGIAA